MKLSKFAMALLGATVIAAAPVSIVPGFDVAPAFAKDKGGEKGGGKDKGSERGNKGGKSAGNSAKAKDKPAKTASAEGAVAKNGKGLLSSELKWLNAAHASANAMENANPNSRVGQVAAYRDAVLGVADAETKLSEAEAELARLSGLTAEELAAEFPDENGYDDGAYQAALDAAGEGTEEYERLAGLTDEERAGEFPSDYDAGAYAEALGGAASDITDAGSDLADAELLQDETLEIAKDGIELSDDGLAYLHELLGLEPPVVEDETVTQ